MNTNTTQFFSIPIFSLTERNCRWNLARMFMESDGLVATPIRKAAECYASMKLRTDSNDNIKLSTNIIDI